MRKALYSLVCLFAAILPLVAQPDSTAEKRPPAGRLAWFACTSMPQGFANPVKVMSGKDLTELELPEFMTSAAVKIPADGVLRIVREVPDPDHPEKPKYLVLAEATVPESVKEALIILGPLPKPKGDLVFNANVQDLAKFKGGDRLFINLSTTNIRVRMGDTKVLVPPRQASLYESPKLAAPVNKPIMYEFYHPEKKQWKIITASTVVIRPTRREICIFNDGTRLGNIKKHSILFPVQIEAP